MSALRVVIVAALRRRRLQSVGLAMVLLLASGAATLALDTLIEANAPFDHAFAAANGAHLIVDFDGTLSPAQLAATASATGVTQAAGPWPVAIVGLERPSGSLKAGGTVTEFGQAMVSGRSDPNTPVDRLTVSSGRWWRSAGEVVVSQEYARQAGVGVGQTIRVMEPRRAGKENAGGPASGPVPVPVPGSGDVGAVAPLKTESLQIVGIAGSVSTPDTAAWMSPSDIAAITPGVVPMQEMLYRVDPSGTTADLVAAESAIAALLPSDTVLGTQTYLMLRTGVDRTANLMVPILLAFSIFALLAAGFVIVNIVSGVVLSRYRELGLMKSLGYTPSQVTLFLAGQILLPVLVGTMLGVALGTLASQPVLEQQAHAFGLPAAFRLSAPVIVAVTVACLGTAVVALLAPAWRAGRLSAITAMTRGTAPSMGAGHGSLRRAVLRLPGPDPIRLGVAASAAHPVRAAMTFGALAVGVAALVFAIGMEASLREVGHELTRDVAAPVRADFGNGSSASESVISAITSAPDTGHVVTVGSTKVAVGRLGTVSFTGYRGDSSWIGYGLIEGRWFSAPGEVVAPTTVFTQTGLHVGDHLTATLDGRALTLTLVGEIFDTANEDDQGLLLRGEWSDVATLDPALVVTELETQPRAGISAADYRSELVDATSGSVDIYLMNDSTTDEGYLLFEGVIAVLGLALVFISVGGVLNTVLLETRSRRHEIAVFKAVGMTPRQVVAMIVGSILPAGLLAGLVGVPFGLLLQRVVLDTMGQAAGGTRIPASVLNILSPATLLALAFGGIVIGVAGALSPALRAARARIAPVLQAE